MLRTSRVVNVVAVLFLAACTGAAPTPSGTESPAAPSTATPLAEASPSSTPSGSQATATKLGGQIVFENVGDDAAHSQVWVENADASQARQLVTDSFSDGEPALSPDGKTVAFDQSRGVPIDAMLADPGVDGGIMLVNVDGSGLHRLATHLGIRNKCGDGIEGDAFSPDGRTLVFTRLCVTGSFGLWIAAVDGSDEREVTRSTTSPQVLRRFLRDGIGFVHLEDHRATWSPDGKHLVFERIDTSTTPERAAIFTIAVDGSDLRQVTDWSVDGNDPDWSPDGRLIVFNAPAEEGGEQNIYTIHPDGSGLTKLTDFKGTDQTTFHPSWSPDGRHILFSHSPATDGFVDLLVMNADGTDRHALAATKIHENHAFWGPSPSP